jgi:NCS1 family nucleobase:cation symporter-1
VHKQKVIIDDMFTLDEDGTYWYTKGYNPAAIIATAIGAVVAVIPVLANGVYGMHTAAQYSWFIGCGVGLLVYIFLVSRTSLKLPELKDAVPQGA